MFQNAAIVGVGQSAYTRRPEPGQTALTFIRDAIVAALDDAGVDACDIDGMAVSSLSIAPDAAVDVAWKLGLSLRWLMQDTNGGSSPISARRTRCARSRSAPRRRSCVVGGDATGLEGYAKLAANFNRATANIWRRSAMAGRTASMRCSPRGR